MTNAGAYFSLGTPPGEGGIHVIRLAGQRARSIVETCFMPARAGSSREGASLEYGHVKDGEQVLDEVLLARVAAANPWGELFEINLHGGPAPLEAVCGLFERIGALQISSARFLRRGSRPDDPPAAWRARALLPRARTPFAAAVFAAQADGLLARSIGRLSEALARFAEGGPLEEAGNLLNVLAERMGLGRSLVSPPLVQILGPPNAGKSTLFNAMLGKERTIVDVTPGTTRDRVREDADLLGVPIRLCDSAGLTMRPAGPADAAGVEEARRGAAEASLRLFLFDGARTPSQDDLCEWSDLAEPRLALAGKMDLPGSDAVRTTLGRAVDRPILAVSGLKEEGLEELGAAALAAMDVRLFPGKEEAVAVPLGGRLARLIEEARKALDLEEAPAVRRIAKALERYASGGGGRSFDR